MDSDARMHISFRATHNAPNEPTAPHPPSAVEAKYYYYGLPSKPRLIARSSFDSWVEPRGPEAYLIPKELAPLGFGHPLERVWESTVGPKIVRYLDSVDVKFSSLDALRIGYAGDTSPPPIVWIGILPGTLTAEAGVDVAVQCKKILSANGIDDVHVELRESEVFRRAQLYKPVPASFPTIRVIEPFSTAVGLPISTEACPTVGGTGGFFISNSSYPGELFLITARHVVIPSTKKDNKLFKFHNSQPPRNVLLFSESATAKHLTAIESEITGKKIIAGQLERRLKVAEGLEEGCAKREKKVVKLQLENVREDIEVLQKFLPEAIRDWENPEDRAIAQVFLSPPIALNVGTSGFTEDWAILKVDASKINSTNFVGNVLDLGTNISVDELISWMYPNPADLPSFEYLGDRLLNYSGFIPDEEMWQPNQNTRDNDNDPIIKVIKRGQASGLTVGRLNTIRSFTRYCFDGGAGITSKEVAVLPRNSSSGPFSTPGDSGSSVVDGKGRMAGLLTGGAGVSDASDCTYITSINFLRKRMESHDFKANFFPFLTA